MALKNIKKTEKLYVRIAEQINQSILDGTFKPGTKLPAEREIAEQLGVSRPSVREALAVLEILGVIDIKVGDGSYVKGNTSNFTLEVNDLKKSAPFELVEARRFIEPLVVELAVERATNTQIAILQETTEVMRKHIDDNMEEFFTQGVKFHTELGNASNNEVLSKIVEQLVHPDVHPIWKLLNQKALVSKEARLHQIEEHEEIIEAIKTKNKDLAKKAVAHHLKHLEELLLF
ncbi:FadR/GntR family transcriptional regulator [Neobacillus pocheonensis]|uniref:FadR/GntR family transcriptional regulator n=1 Tax=Neobacillus pocheonensis TaxID=363869 RepID=UPI003D28F947